MQGPKWTEKQRAARIDHLLERNRSQHGGQFLYEDVEWMRDAYETRRLSLRQMSIEAECGLRTIARWMETHGIPRREAKPTPRYGPDHHAWRGGPAKCPHCDGPCSWGATSCMKCYDKTGDKNPKWRGDRIGNPAMHDRVKALRGVASTHICAHDCGRQAEHWAYDHSDPAELSDPEGPFSLDPMKYLPLCNKCHKRFDMRYLREQSA